MGSPTPSGLDLDTQDWDQEPDISPMSKKILENCTASTTVASTQSPIKAAKGFSATAATDITSSLFHRPASSGFAPSAAGFQFARPPPPKAGPGSRFSLRPGPKPTQPSATPITGQAPSKNADSNQNSRIQDTPIHARTEDASRPHDSGVPHDGTTKATETQDTQNEAAPTTTLPSPKRTVSRPASNQNAPDAPEKYDSMIFSKSCWNKKLVTNE